MALRRGTLPATPEVAEIKDLIENVRVQMIGPIRQEILSGVKTRRQFDDLRERLRGFPDLPLVGEDYELAAEYYTELRSKGIQGSNTDFLICATDIRNDLAVFTTDKDFLRFRGFIPLRLHAMRSGR
jgi:hypothetical protein